ncbi:DNA topoisomerase [Neohortaea acidophila]|uniref:DNA topoisomerase n=1 Tax=Neohortaea acidophila TaxID=245834 RepID=A0A6A6Q2D9_9PEZI|nr:DNA topoisomerase [Neohortaea acidophila]KAF2486560.1 DNA topoisomerase [Neohortaea acidophila]
MATKVLCVAEKPSIAKAVANHLSGNQVTVHNVQGNQFIKNYQFQYNFPRWGHSDVTMTSVSGHLVSQDFNSRYRQWRSCDPVELFEAPIDKYVENDKKPIERNIEVRARQSEVLFIWTDCDREGENIGAEIRDIAVRSNRLLADAGKTVRAHFSNIERAHIIAAARNPVTIDEAQSNAVASRIELDLRIGASFTRNLTMSIQPMLQDRGGEKQVISYGSCQFPTLGFVVERYFRVRNFVPEKFWSIKVMHEKDGVKVNFSWARNHLFDRMMVVILFERCLAARTARVTKVQTKPTSKWKPLPLTTVELQKCGSRFLRMDSQRVMHLAEQLYQKGWISYPRTETDQFDRGMDLQALVRKQTQGGPWQQFAHHLANGGFSAPRNGRNNDKAHPPIHPVNFVDPSVLNAEERRVHEFIVRRFLACCSQDAKGSMTTVALLYGSETFTAYGLTVLERNYLDVYPYDKWTSSQELPDFREGEVFVPTEARMHEGLTSPPGYLTEPELIALMDANGIGTDATMAEHIAKIKDRKYVETRSQGAAGRAGDDDISDDDEPPPVNAGRGRGRGRGRGGRGGAGANGRGAGTTRGVQEFIPTTLGVALVEGYESMGFEISLTKPFLRKEMELKMKAICEGRKTRQEVVEETLAQYRVVYNRTQQRLEDLRASVRKYVLGQGE